jgi:hypothetical protein
LAPVFCEARVHVRQDFFADGLHHAVEVLAEVLLHLAGAGGANVVDLGDGLADASIRWELMALCNAFFCGLLQFSVDSGDQSDPK